MVTGEIEGLRARVLVTGAERARHCDRGERQRGARHGDRGAGLRGGRHGARREGLRGLRPGYWCRGKTGVAWVTGAGVRQG